MAIDYSNRSLVSPNMIMMSTSSFYTLKKNLIENIGSYKTKGFLYRFGYEIGVSAAKEKMHLKTEGAQLSGKTIHSMFGHVREVILDPNVGRLLADGVQKQISGKWIDSFEANVHLQNFGLSDECVCFTLCGYASGFLSYLYGRSIITVETKCVAKGDPCCEFEIRLEENWLPEYEDIIKIYKESTILSELEMTYDALLRHKQLLDKISTFYSKLTQSVTEKHTMQEIIQLAYDILKIPILIEDLHGDELLYTGLTDAQLEIVRKDRPNLEHEQDFLNVSLHKCASYAKLVSPVLINKKHYATCSFIYMAPQQMEENDHLYLERIASATALCFLYEEAKFEEQERMTHKILDRLIHKQYMSIKDIEPYFKFLPFKFKPPFSTAVIKVKQKQTAEPLMDLYEQLLLFSRLFKQYNVPAVFSIVGEEIVLLNAQYHDHREFMRIMKIIIGKAEKKFENFQYSMGISHAFEDLSRFEQSLKEARLAQKFPNKKTITRYEDLGFLGNFVANMSVEQIHEVARNILNDLYDFEDKKKKELLYTLYRYLANGQRLKDTMEELSLSIGGLQYRIKLIQSMLNKNLKNSSEAAYILLTIESLLLLGTLNFECGK